MGGSLALALKERHLCRQVTALVRRESAVQAALNLGAVDVATTDPAEAFTQANLIIFATPVRVLLQQLPQFAPFYPAGAIITDMGSTKQAIMQAMAALPPQVYPIGSHPMCGKETSGLEVAEATLYQNAPWILTPLDRTPLWVTTFMHEFALAIGAKPRQLDAARHDKLVATISHFPHTLSTALVLTAMQVAHHDPVVWNVAASGFRDTSRIAASDVTMMLDILLTNREAVLTVLGEFDRQLGALTQAIADNDEVTLRNLMEQAAHQRRQLYQ